MAEFTHLDDKGDAHMVDVGSKPLTDRSATAEAAVRMAPETLAAIQANDFAKGDVLQVARIAGIMAAKRTDELIPLCHSLPLNEIHVDFEVVGSREIKISATAKCHGKTGVEMEAMTAASIAALTIYDMCKSMDRGMEIAAVRLTYKSGGKSGTFRRDADSQT